MNIRDQKFINETLHLARAGDRVGGARLGAILTIGNQVVSMGQNMYKTHPLQKKFARRPDAIFQHAEINCIINFLRNNDATALKRATLYVGRVFGNNMESIGTAKPCSGCAGAIEHYGIKRVVHT
jgi:tRNA(Arg) A34 adenosine deaminase TadA